MMRKLSKILVPIDFSEESARALKYALSLASEIEAEVVALHVVEKADDGDFLMSSVAILEGSPFPVNEFSTIPVDVLLRERSLDLWNFIERTVVTNNQVKITKRIKMGSILKAMTATIQEEDINLVVLELRKRAFPDLEALKLIKLIRSLPCPVLLDPRIAHPTHEPKKGLLWFQPALQKLGLSVALSPDEAGDPGGSFRHGLI
jgi:nucleotide-binding universal stress UspA family protein